MTNLTKYNHAYDFAFSLENYSSGGATTTAQELRAALQHRLNTITDNELIESCGYPFDTYEV